VGFCGVFLGFFEICADILWENVGFCGNLVGILCAFLGILGDFVVILREFCVNSAGICGIVWDSV